MFGINAFNPVSLLATAALGPGGGIIAQLATQVLSQAGQQIIQQFGEQLGLPQSTIDFAQSNYAATNGDFAGGVQNLNEGIAALGDQFNASPSDIGAAQYDAQQSINDFVSTLSESNDFREARAGGAGKGGGWLMAMATVLGKELNSMSHDMERMAGQIGKDTPDLTAKFGALSQQFSILMNATTTAIKTVGEAMANTARKQ